MKRINILQQNSLTVFIVLFSSLSNNLPKSQAHNFIYSGCSQQKYEANSPFEANLNSLLSSFISSSSQALYNSFATSPTPENSIFGLYQCRGDLKISDCTRCVESGVSQIGLVCPYTYGANLQLEGCYIRYEHVNFLGTVDTSVMYKKCSKNSVSNDVEFFRRRDDVLDDLQRALGFRVSSSGAVEGFAQCLGDISSSDCSTCLGEAVGKLKILCGSAAAADVYLAQCYVRYWASGYYESTSDSSKDDQVGKMVAIVVGGVAALAVLVVLLSICRKTARTYSISTTVQPIYEVTVGFK